MTLLEELRQLMAKSQPPWAEYRDRYTVQLDEDVDREQVFLVGHVLVLHPDDWVLILEMAAQEVTPPSRQEVVALLAWSIDTRKREPSPMESV